MKNENLFKMPIKSINNYIKNTLIKTTEFEIKKHNIIEFGNKRVMLKVARMTKENEGLSFKEFNKFKKYTYHLNQIYLNEFDSLLLCLIFLDKFIYILITKEELETLTLTAPHNKIDCFQCDIDIKKYINNQINL